MAKYYVVTRNFKEGLETCDSLEEVARLLVRGYLEERELLYNTYGNYFNTVVELIIKTFDVGHVEKVKIDVGEMVHRFLHQLDVHTDLKESLPDVREAVDVIELRKWLESAAKDIENKCWDFGVGLSSEEIKELELLVIKELIAAHYVCNWKDFDVSSPSPITDEFYNYFNNED